jgi:RNA polymerase sigma-70 factor (ECF subfamily)
MCGFYQNYSVAPLTGIIYSSDMGMDVLELYERACRAWPTLVLDRDVWRRHLDALGWSDESPPFPEHLYLACACGRGDAEALRLVDGQFVSPLLGAAQRKLRDLDAAEEVLQLTRERLFTGPEPRILTYRGSGHLRVWLMMVMSRLIASSKRSEAAQHRRERGLVELWEEIAEGLPQRPSVQPQAVELVERCLRRAFAALPARDRAVMKLYYLEGLSIDAIGTMYTRHRSQVARWLVGCRDRVRDELRRQVQREIGGIGESEVGSLLRMLQEEIDVTISTLLASTHGITAPTPLVTLLVPLPSAAPGAERSESRPSELRAEEAPPRE